MPSASSLFFVLFLLQKDTSGNILGIGRKFTMIFYSRNEEGSQKGDPGRNPQPWGGSHPRPRVGPRQEAVPALSVASGAPLRTPSSSWRKNNPRKFRSNSENISRSKFLKQKDSKNRELALGILSIG